MSVPVPPGTTHRLSMPSTEDPPPHRPAAPRLGAQKAGARLPEVGSQESLEGVGVGGVQGLLTFWKSGGRFFFFDPPRTHLPSRASPVSHANNGDAEHPN